MNVVKVCNTAGSTSKLDQNHLDIVLFGVKVGYLDFNNSEIL